MLTLLTIAVVGLFCALGFLHFVTNAELMLRSGGPDYAGA